MKLGVVVSGLVLALSSQMAFAERKECRAAEEALSDVSVKIVHAYNAGDMDKAAELERQALLQIDKGETTAKSCGCAGVTAGTNATKASLNKSIGLSALDDVQNELVNALKNSEEARLEAEKCWRGEALVSAKKA